MSQDLNRFFQAEAEDLLSRMTAALERLRHEPLTPEALRDLRRWAHTLKGAAQVVRREEIAGSAHRLETALDALAEANGGSSALENALLLASEMMRALMTPQPQPASPAAAPVAAKAAAPGPDEGIGALRIELAELDRLLQAVGESGIVASGLRNLSGPLARVGELAAMMRQARAGAAGEEHAEHSAVLAEEIQDAVAELRRELDQLTERIERQLEGLRTRTEHLRLVRAATMIPIIEQSVRAAAQAAGKTVVFESGGGELELDAHVLIAARDALIQVSRNAVAHGIESPEERLTRGKPAVGRIHLEIRREGSGHVLAVRDDGRGIDFEALREQAVRRGWLTASQAREATSQDLAQILLRPGVTTAAYAGTLAGRGVGLDLVSNMVARLKGELRISADPGQGTTVEIRVPASMNSASLLMVRAGGMGFGIPLDSVRKTASMAGVQRVADRFLLDGRLQPMVALASVFALEPGDPRFAVEVLAHPSSFLLAVEELEGVRQTVIHTLPEHLEAEPWVLGAAVESEGSLRVVLDPPMLAATLDRFTRNDADREEPGGPSLPILVIDDSLTTRMLEQSIFEMEGYTVDLASSAEEALQMARQRTYGLFLVDVEMPGVDGFSFVEMTRRDPQLQETPAILVTSRGSAEDRARGLQAGAREYVVKSEFDQRLLLNRVRELMRAR